MQADHLASPSLDRRSPLNLPYVLRQALTNSTSSSSAPSTSTSSLAPASSSATTHSASISLNGTRVVLGRGYSNGQLTYTVPITIADQQLNFQLDTGSADLWVANTACSTDSCKGRQGGSVKRFDDSDDGVIDQDTPFQINYLLGGASGSVKTATMLLGNPAFSRLAVNAQAFGSANSVNHEDLDTGNFSGVLGLGLPANSLIQASMNDTSDTASLNDGVSNPDTGALLNGLWRNSREGRRFVGLGLQRLEEEGGRGDSILTVGSHDPVYAGNDTSKIVYSPVVADGDGVARHWRVFLTSMTVSVRGNTVEQIPVGQSSVMGQGYPLAILDSGASINLGPTNVLNALYGAWNIGPSQDGGYYVPCDLQMNITLTLGGVSVPIHPLDASLYSSTGVGTSSSNAACLGSFQALRSLSGGSDGSNLNTSSIPADFILSNSFLRSAYTVLTCNGLTQDPLDTVTGPCRPQVGFLPLVNMTEATDQFRRVRINKETLGKSGLTDGQTSGDGGGKGLSGGIKIVIGCMVALIAIIFIFGVALWRLRRKRRLIAQHRAAMLTGGGEKGGGTPGHENLDRQISRGFGRGDGLLMPMTTLTKEDDASSNVVLSPAQRAKARQLQQMHGVFDDEPAADEEEAAAAGAAPRWGGDATPRTGGPQPGGTTSWDVSSTGYMDARKVKNEYLKKLTDEERRAFNAKQAALDTNGSDHSENHHGHYRSGSPSPLLRSQDRR